MFRMDGQKSTKVEKNDCSNTIYLASMFKKVTVFFLQEDLAWEPFFKTAIISAVELRGIPTVFFWRLQLDRPLKGPLEVVFWVKHVEAELKRKHSRFH